ncbi:PSME3-interacting protein [Geodia barretti]|uniref:PSME3-interacting protein n=1 Tax=Geodia barretti TaxID=519541 RepID=A0AA35R221_GEOBA|nr:PSME3-interacting protein [Geodia barretti]
MQFISEKEVDEIKAKKQKEWEQVRRSDQPLERPEEAIDNRTLYEKLKAQKNQKQEEFEEQFKFKNMIYKGLNDEEAVFLQQLADKRAQVEAETRSEEREELQAYRDAVEKLSDESDSIKPLSSTATPSASTSSSSSSSLTSSVPNKVPKSQLALIAGSIKTKRKRSSTEDSEVATSPEKKAKLEKSEPQTNHRTSLSL